MEESTINFGDWSSRWSLGAVFVVQPTRMRGTDILIGCGISGVYYGRSGERSSVFSHHGRAYDGNLRSFFVLAVSRSSQILLTNRLSLSLEFSLIPFSYRSSNSSGKGFVPETSYGASYQASRQPIQPIHETHQRFLLWHCFPLARYFHQILRNAKFSACYNFVWFRRTLHWLCGNLGNVREALAKLGS